MRVHRTERDSTAPRPDPVCPGMPVCPLCGSLGLVRIHRRPIDRMLGLFVRVYRFRCEEFECQWEGNLTRRQCGKGTRSDRRESDTR